MNTFAVSPDSVFTVPDWVFTMGRNMQVVNIELFDTGVPDDFTVPAGETLTADVQSNDRLPVNALGDPVDHLDVTGFGFVNNGSVDQIAPGVTNQTGQLA